MNFPAATNLSYAWAGAGLTSHPGFTGTGTLCTNFTGMFNLCTDLVSVGTIDTSAGTLFSNMFNGNSSLTCLTDLDTDSGAGSPTTSSMFAGTTVLANPDGTEQTALLAGDIYSNGGSCP